MLLEDFAVGKSKFTRTKQNVIIVRPQDGPQAQFLASPADICIMGGAAGGGKSYGLLLEPLRYHNNPKFKAVIFRRESAQITNAGGLWDTAEDLYSKFNAVGVKTPKPHYSFKKGMTVSFSHMQYEKDKISWDGSQIALIGFDELQHFTNTQFFYMGSRNRSMSGVASYMRGTCNPDPDSFLVDFLAWWIQQEGEKGKEEQAGFPIAERAGIIRYMVRIENEIYWGDTPLDLQVEVNYKCGKGKYIIALEKNDNDPLHFRPKSVTFIPSKVTDNKILLSQNPEYLSSLRSMLEYEQQRLLGGNWFARPLAGEIFKEHYWNRTEGVPNKYHIKRIVRYWDRASTLPSDVNPDPDYSCGALVAIADNDDIYVLDIVHGRWEAGNLQKTMLDTAKLDGREVPICLEQDPGSAGKFEAQYNLRMLAGYNVKLMPKRSSKLTYWRPLAAQAMAGNVYLSMKDYKNKGAKSKWIKPFVKEAAGVTDGTQHGHDDMVDAVAGGFIYIAQKINASGGLSPTAMIKGM